MPHRLVLHFPRLTALAFVVVLADTAFARPASADSAEAVGPHITASGALQVQAIVGVKESQTAVQRKLDSQLLLGLLHSRGDARLAPLTEFRFLQAAADGRVDVELLAKRPEHVPAVLGALRMRQAEILTPQGTGQILRARVRLEDLEDLAARPEVLRIRKARDPAYSAVNVSEGVTTHGAAEARTFFGTTGAGVKVGVISDGVNSLAALQASGDLPPSVTVLPGQAGNGNEGAAMLEIVHDMAPDAQLYFATASPTMAQLAQNILDLAAAGCQVIVDDVLYFAESAFQDGPVAQAVNTVTANGVLYFSSAGNEGNVTDGTSGTWEGDFAPNRSISGIPGTAHNFGDGGQSIFVTSDGGATLLKWAEHETLNQGLASTDFDIYDMNGALTQVLDASFNVQNGTGGDDFPTEIMGVAFAGERLVVVRFAAGTTTSVPVFNLINFRGQLDAALATASATRAHSAAARAFSVAAAPAAGGFGPGEPTGPYPALYNPGQHSETFSSDGPRRIILRPDGTEITPGNRTKTGGVVRQKPDIAAADGVACAAPGFNPFFGTSAAAPHAAAIAALLKSALPGITADEVRDALVGSAIDIETPGSDRDTGAGIVMAHAALDRAGAIGPLGPEPMEVDAHAATGTSSNLNGVWEPGESVQISPAWKNNQLSSQALTGSAASLAGPAEGGTSYNLVDAAASYGTIATSTTNSCHAATANCYVAAVTNTSPVAHWDATFTETLSTGLPRLWELHIGNTFPDVPVTNNPFYPFIENLIHNGVTGGCGSGNYCPNSVVTRAQMAVFLLKSKFGSSHIPPPCTGAVFPDVPCTGGAFDPWIEELNALGITGGCGGGLYCPNNAVTRKQMAIFLLKTLEGSSYVPPPPTGIFDDVPADTFRPFIEELYKRQITGGCAGGPPPAPISYCPESSVTRGQMAAFLVRTFGLALYGP